MVCQDLRLRSDRPASFHQQLPMSGLELLALTEAQFAASASASAPDPVPILQTAPKALPEPAVPANPPAPAGVAIQPEFGALPPGRSDFTPLAPPQVIPRPRSGSQLFVQRWAALRAGRLYTRLPSDSFQDLWSRATRQPTHEDWKRLLAQEARVVAQSQGRSRLSVLVGDSLTLWLPPEDLAGDRLWLNQSISGETSAHVLSRLQNFAQTRPDTIYVMAGVNDLKQGASDNTVLWNLRVIMRRLRQTHPSAQIVVQSILPTRLDRIPGDRVARLNQRLATIARQENAQYLDLYSAFADFDGNLRPELTTDGLHLSAQGYQLWQQRLQQSQWTIAQS